MSDTPPKDPIKAVIYKLSKSRFFTVSLFIHIILIVSFGGTVLFQTYIEPQDFEGSGGSFVDSLPSIDIPTPQQQTNLQQVTTQQPTVAQKTKVANLKALTTINPSAANFTLPTIAPKIAPLGNMTAAPTPPPAAASAAMTRETAMQIKNFTQGWGKGQSGTGTGTGMRRRQFQFTAYLGKYAGGDWQSTVQLRSNKITTGSLPNFLFTMKKWSGDRIDANPDPVPLDLSDEAKILATKPPFIMLNGRRDFKLTDREISNLQKYLRLGGAIWGDSQLAGRGSRFDIAFRREMRRVVPDVNKDFEPIPENHPIFTDGYWKEIRTVVPGMNYHQEPIYVLRVYDEIAVLYTANNYCDMWQIGLKEDGSYELGVDERGQQVAMNMNLYNNRNTFFRNLDAPAVVDSLKLGTNIVMHLITRWERRVSTVSGL